MPNQKWRLPIVWLGEDGQTSSLTAVVRHPYLPIEISASGDKWMPHLAMVDTGSTFSLVDKQSLEAISATPRGTKRMTGNWSQLDVGPIEYRFERKE